MGEVGRAARLAAVTVAIGVAAAACTAGSSGASATRSARTTRSPGTSAASGTSTGRPPPSRSVAAGFPLPPGGGRVITRTIPGRTSHFRARPALIWLPPILSRYPHRRLPVLELLHGTTGGPIDWLQKGVAGPVLAQFAHAHGGQAPIVVMPDVNGALHADTECITDRYGADVEKYLSVDVPAWVDRHLPVRTDRRWAVAGLSEGGTCALMLALRHRHQYGIFGDFSGFARATVSKTDDPPATVRKLFHGSWRAYHLHDPLWLLRHHRYPTTAGWVEYGKDDEVRAPSLRVVAEARAAGIPIRDVEVTGGHGWNVWTESLRSMLPWAWARLA